MDINLGTVDRIVRAFIAAPALAIAGYLIGPGGWIALGFYAVALTLASTAIASWCPAYHVLGLRSCPLPPSR